MTSAAVRKIKERSGDYKPVLATIGFLFTLLMVPVGLHAEDDDDEQESPVTQSVTAGGRTLEVSAAIQKQAGIQIARPELIELRPEVAVQGRIMDLRPLLQQQAQTGEAQSVVELARAVWGRRPRCRWHLPRRQS